ncbi:MAG: ABC transporter permease subunit [Clostridiales Family XIII bacterium]|nr:ABC transporter permease subunit [Clostridiales Family XIII bacterium]
MSKTRKTILVLLPFLGWMIVVLNYFFIPDINDMFRKKPEYPIAVGLIVLFFVAKCIYFKFCGKGKLDEYLSNSPRIFVLLLAFFVWDLVTAKFGLISAYFFKDGSRIVAAVTGNWQIVLRHTLYSLRLLFLGYFCGLAAGFLTGSIAGWFPKVRYWVMPVVKKIGPIPASIWTPFIVVITKALFTASVVSIAFGVWFPVTLMTATGLISVPSAYYEVARTLGAKPRFLFFRVALPSALPNLFMGMFMGMTISCVSLIAAELLGAEYGLGWFINTSTAWGEYDKVYAGVIIILLIFSTVISQLFRINGKLLKWQKDKVQW